MIFNSLHFLIFLPIAIAAYYATPYKWRWLLLTALSYYFYMCWKAEYAFLIAFSTTVDYLCGIQMSKTEDDRKRKRWMLASIIMNLGQLFLFKYFNFFNESTRAIFDSFNIFYNVPEFKLLLPVGISFYTFQSISYSVDVYKRKAPVEKHFGYFAMFVSYWPQLVAGPIERSWYMLPRLKANHDFSYDNFREGLIRVLWGFFKKAVIADRLAIFVRAVYSRPEDYGGFDIGHIGSALTSNISSLNIFSALSGHTALSIEHGGFAIILATWLFAIQVYCDFGGYCDIAIGCARMMGHNLTDNFKTPYFSKSISEFWQRWHITLTSWIRDYLYIPLGGNRVSFSRLLFNTWFMLAVMGFWHGANWTFVMFGIIHGFFLVMSRVSEKFTPNLKLNLGKNFKWLTNFILMFWIFNLTCIPDIFFCSRNIGEAFHIIGNIFTGADTTHYLLHYSSPAGATDSLVEFYISLVFIVLLLAVDFYLYRNNDITIDQSLVKKPVAVRWSFYILFAVLLAWFAVTSNSIFIYFQF